MLRKLLPALAGWLAVASSLPGWSATVLETSELLAATPAAAAAPRLPIESATCTAGVYVSAFQDLAEPVALQSLQVLVTHDLQEVAKFEVEYPPPPGASVVSATETFAGTPGVYRVHVLGTINPAAVGGLFGISVTPAAGGAALLQEIESVAANGGPGANQSALLATFTVPEAGTYQVDLTDYGFPSALTQADSILLRRTAASALPVLIGEGAFIANSAGESYELRVVATAGPDQAGLYGVSVIGGPSGSVAYRSDNAVGQLPPATTFNVAASGTHALTLSDLDFPQPLTELRAAVTQNGAVAGSFSGEGASNIQLNQGAAQLFVFATPASTGAMSVTVSQGAQVDYADIHIADASSDPATAAIYSFTPSQAVTAGNYTLTIADFRFPSQLPSLRTAVVQGTTVVHLAGEAVAETLALQAGAVRVLVAATPPASGTAPGNGMFGLTLAAQPGGAVVFEGTQGVGGLFNSRPVNLPVAGRYDVSLEDFEFPERLRTSWLAITRGTTLVGQVIGSGLIQNEPLEAGTYVLNFLGQPAATSSFGAFGLKVANSAPPPVVTFSASPTSVTSGSQTTLQWSASNATSCTASGGWTGSKTVSGTQQSGALTANTTFEIECAGPGGRDDASVTVTVNAPSPSGGGGQVDLSLSLMLLVLLTARGKKRTQRKPATPAA